MFEEKSACQVSPRLPGRMVPESLDEILTLEECASWLRVRPRDLKDKVRAGRIPAIRLNQRVFRFHPRTVLLKLGVPKDAVGMTKNHEPLRHPPNHGSV